MQQYSSWDSGVSGPAVSSSTIGQVMALLGLASVFTALGAYIAPYFAGFAWFVSLIGALGCLFILQAVRERSPLNVIMLCAFATFEGILLGVILWQYVAAGMGVIVVNAAISTAAITLVAGVFGYTTKRDLRGLGKVLFLTLIGVLIAMIVGFFIQLTAYQIALSAIACAVFTGLLVYDMNRVAQAPNASQGTAIMLTVSIYLDILNLFLWLLRILSIFRR